MHDPVRSDCCTCSDHRRLESNPQKCHLQQPLVIDLLTTTI
ncbi:replication initiation protein [Pectobacterium carotovorum subsp. carotovorum]|nr:replication initiation protein [Pectobacterium carotovorum subsp. carotovorum]PWD68325.1 replication initiation protein [Pectobacterium versatile]TAI93336.1 replication initiation protein [Pectobacterium versatile]